MTKITVVNKHHGLTGVYIGRGSPLGNPFPIDVPNGQTREIVIGRYRLWLMEKIEQRDQRILDSLNWIAEQAQTKEGVVLQCFCKPHACHGDVIREIILNKIKENESNNLS